MAEKTETGRKKVVRELSRLVADAIMTAFS